MYKYLVCMLLLTYAFGQSKTDLPAGEKAKGTKKYSQYEKPEVCKSCHTAIYQQWKRSMMSQSFTHHWDEIEYFELAVPHAENNPDLKDAVDGCNGCHAPLSYLAGDLPPPRPAEGSRANEGVSCDLCHSIRDVENMESPFNYSYISDPGRIKFGSKPGLESPHHITKYNEIFEKTELCGSCHNEKSPYGVWVKSTQIEWEEGPYSKEGVKCFDCHMPGAVGRSASMAKMDTVAQHVFLGAHKPAKLRGSIELSMHCRETEIPYDGTALIQVELFNAKAGHKIPTGSVEDRILWLHVEARDSQGNKYHLKVDEKGFEGEKYTIASDELAYKDFADALGLENFKGLKREEVPVGDRIFRMPYFDQNGVMTIMQWNTRALGVDYRIGPRETKIETFSWPMPGDIAFGEVEVTATLNYRKLVKPVAEYLEVPAEESEIVTINKVATSFEVYE